MAKNDKKWQKMAKNGQKLSFQFLEAFSSTLVKVRFCPALDLTIGASFDLLLITIPLLENKKKNDKNINSHISKRLCD